MKSINPTPAAKVLGITFLFVGIILGLVISLLAWFRPESVAQPELPTLLLQPVIFAVAGYIATRIFCAIYNRVAGKWGGIRISLTEIHSPFNPKWKP